MEDVKLKPYTLDVALTGYFPIPRELLEMELPQHGDSDIWGSA